MPATTVKGTNCWYVEEEVVGGVAIVPGVSAAVVAVAALAIPFARKASPVEVVVPAAAAVALGDPELTAMWVGAVRAPR